MVDRFTVRGVEKFKAFVDWIRDEHTDLAYRYVYGAHFATRGPWETLAGYVTLHQRDGGYVLRAGGDEELFLADAAEIEAFHSYLEQRYVGDRYPDMGAWERQQHEWYMEWP